jgi:hypothetical protein
MRHRPIALSAAAFLLAIAAVAAEPECATNFRADGTATETFVLTSLTPQTVIERLPSMLVAAGATMEWAEPQKGILKAKGLDIKAETSGNATRVTFRSSVAADKTSLCRFASLIGNSPKPPKAAVPQDPALISQLKDDLIKKHQIVQPGLGSGLNNAMFRSEKDFLEFAITAVSDVADGKREYEVSMLLPRNACGIATEDLDDSSTGINGQLPEPRTKPARVDATLVYANEGGSWHLAGAAITHIESTK